MYIDSGSQPAPLKCPCCGKTLSDLDYVYFDDNLHVVGCEYCIIRDTAIGNAERLEESA